MKKNDFIRLVKDNELTGEVEIRYPNDYLKESIAMPFIIAIKRRNRVQVSRDPLRKCITVSVWI